MHEKLIKIKIKIAQELQSEKQDELAWQVK